MMCFSKYSLLLNFYVSIQEQVSMNFYVSIHTETGKNETSGRQKDKEVWKKGR